MYEIASDQTLAEGDLGLCRLQPGAENESEAHFYDSGGTPFTAQGAQQTCGNLGGVWEG